MKNDTEELFQKCQEARSKLREARQFLTQENDKYREALIRDRIAELEAAGMPLGSKVRAYHGEFFQGEYLIQSVSVPLGKARIHLCKFKKDGTPYLKTPRVSFDRLEPVQET